MSSFTVIIPTLNEEANIDRLLEQIFVVKKEKKLDLRVLFVDSDSADCTCDKIRRWEASHPVKLLCRDVNHGLACAVMEGAQHAETDFIVVMDADLSHPPEVIPQLIYPVLEGSYDMVVGSRYVKGGSMPDWPIRRKISSIVATLPALMFCDIKDPLAGFFALSRDLLTTLPGSIPGFKIGLAVLAENKGEIRVKEIPIEFKDRDQGESKMNNKVAVDYLRQLLQLTANKISGRIERVKKK